MSCVEAEKLICLEYLRSHLLAFGVYADDPGFMIELSTLIESCHQMLGSTL